MESFPGIPALTREQQDILDTCPPRRDLTRKGQLTRVTAAAGAGKTTTLLALAAHAIQLGHDHITYVTFTKSAAADGKERLERVLKSQQNPAIRRRPPTIDARTLHSCATVLLQKYIKDSSDDSLGARSKLWSDRDVKRWISNTCRNEIDSFLGPCLAEIGRTSKDHSVRRGREIRCRDQVEFFIYKSLDHFCQSDWTLATYKSGQPFSRDYYPAKLFHGPKGKGKDKAYGFPPRFYDRKDKIGFYADQAARLWKMVLAEDFRSFNFEMKRAQLLKLQVPGSILLVDESQDMDSCQVDWISKQQVEFGTHVYVVGDAAQAIYGFRGAKPQFLMQLECDNDRMLTESWRFGPAISRIANLILYSKEKSDQTAMTYDGKYKNWIPYRTRPGVRDKEGRVTLDTLVMDWQSTKVTMIARTNARLLLEALSVLGFTFTTDDDDDNQVDVPDDDELPQNHPSQHMFSQTKDDVLQVDDQTPGPLPKIHINGRGEQSGLKLWKKSIQLIEAVYALYRLEKQDPSAMTQLDDQLFPDFARKQVTWTVFRDECTQKELSKYNNVIGVVSMCKNQTLEAVELFQRHVMERQVSAEDADIILTTCHAAKGMEWDNVQVCDDFTELNKFKPKAASKTPAPPADDEIPPNEKKPRLSASWKFDFAAWGDDVNLLYVACTRAKGTLSIPRSIYALLDTIDAMHSWFLSKDSGANNIALMVPGYKHPLNAEQAAAFYDSLVLPLRLECEVLGDQALKPELVEAVSTFSDGENENDGGSVE
jgi:superfamily I DNA/RNA helicase